MMIQEERVEQEHGWTLHGWPCCKSAPLDKRPDVVTACAMAFPAQQAPVEICVECVAAIAAVLHGRMAWTVRPSDWSPYLRYAHPGTAVPPWSGLITGIS